MLVTHYTLFEGGEWEPWPGGAVLNFERHGRNFLVQGINRHEPFEVHALRFENGQEWDAINGSRGDLKIFH